MSDCLHCVHGRGQSFVGGLRKKERKRVKKKASTKPRIRWLTFRKKAEPRPIVPIRLSGL